MSMYDSEVGQCLYFACDTEVYLIMVFVAFIVLFAFYLIENIPKWLRLRECKSGNHRKIVTYHSGFGGGYETIECECGKYKYLHDLNDDLTFRIK